MPRPVHFEIHADNPERASAFCRTLFDGQFEERGNEPYWLVKAGEKGTPGIDGGGLPRRGPSPAAAQPASSFVCTVDVASVDACLKRIPERRHDRDAQEGGPDIGWLFYAKDSQGNPFGVIQFDGNAN